MPRPPARRDDARSVRRSTVRPSWRWAGPAAPSTAGSPRSWRAGSPTAPERGRFGGRPAGREAPMDEKDILSRISSLVEEEHALRENAEHDDDQRTRMSEL